MVSKSLQTQISASKFALEGAMEALRMEVRPFGIHVVLIEPGDFKTGITTQRQKAEKSTANSAYSGTFQKVLRIVESGERKAPTPERIAILLNKIIQMNSPRLRYTVGTFSQRIAVPLKKILPSRLFESLISGSFQAN
jgi:NAD(P)-dependent dehydrogenase (short-subunit alcohol dehydrogenase family)